MINVMICFHTSTLIIEPLFLRTTTFYIEPVNEKEKKVYLYIILHK